MEMLKQQILRQAEIVGADVLRLDSILNHQVDPVLIMEMGKELAKRFAGESINKVLTMESSGIPPAFAAAYYLNVPLVFARRKKTIVTDEDVYCERVPSFTKGIVTDIVVSQKFIGPADRILLIDDIIANGDAARGLLRIVEKSGAHLVGVGIAVEKTFQAGARFIRESGVRVESLVQIASLENGAIRFVES
ncbi:MAG TPA: xanthine phosphoribosyltransferase [Bacilli bacterium]